MAGDAPAYVSGQELGGGSGNTIAIAPLQSNLGTEAEKTAGAAEQFVEKIKKADDETKSLDLLSNHYQQVDALKNQYRDDPDPVTAVQRFRGDLAKLQGDTLASAAGMDRTIVARMNLHMVTKGVADLDQVWAAAKGKQKDAAGASLISLERQSENDYMAPGATPVFRQEAVNRYHDALDGAASSGLISQREAAEKKLTFDANLQHGVVIRGISNDPRQTIAALDDPQNFPALSAVQRETYKLHAQRAIDTNGVHAAVAAGANMEAAASMVAGKIVHPDHVNQLYDRVVVAGLESGGKNLEPNKAGAFGPAQLLPGTARDMAKATGRTDLAGLGDKELTDALMKDPAANLALGRAYWESLGKRYGGQVGPMLAGYIAGAGDTDKWQAVAKDRFGPDPTPEQFLSVIPEGFKSTRAYLQKGFALAGVPMDAYGVSPAGRFQMGIALGHELHAEQVQRDHIATQLASVDTKTDPMLQQLENGLGVDPEAFSRQRSLLVDAAATGNPEMKKKLARLDFAAGIQPLIANLKQLPFEQLDTLVNLEQGRLGSGQPVSQQDIDRLRLMTKVRDATATARMENPTRLLVDRGLAPYVPLDTSADPNDPAFRGSLQARGIQAVNSQKLNHGTALALEPNEVATMKERWSQGGANERFGLLKAMADTLPDNAYLDTVKKFSGNADSGLLTANLLRRSPDLAREVLTGEDLMKTKDIGEKTDLARAALAEKVGGQIFPDARQQGAVVDAAIKVDIARRAAAGSLYDRSDMSGVSKAFEDIAGQVVKLNGARTVAPPGMPASQFLSIVEHLDEHDIAAATGLYHADSVGGVPFDPDWLASHAQLKPLDVGSSRYLMVIPTPDGRGAPVMTGVEAPKPLVLDMKMLAERHAKKRAEGIESLVRGIGDYDPVSYQQ